MSPIILPASSASRSSGSVRPRGNWVTRLLLRLAVQRQRRRLADLDQHLLDDIGVTRTQALHESRKPVWDAPDHWFR